MISESGAQNQAQPFKNCNVSEAIRTISAAVEKYDVRYWAWINMDWNSIDMWSHQTFPSGQHVWCNTRVQETAEASWRDVVLNTNSRYLCLNSLGSFSPCVSGKPEQALAPALDNGELKT